MTQPGQPEKGFCGGSMQATAGGQTFAQGVNFKTVLSTTPSSVTLTATSNTNVTGVAYSNLSPNGLHAHGHRHGCGVRFVAGYVPR